MTNGQRKMIFRWCKMLKIADDGRRILAGSFRRDGVESMKGMDVREAGLMIMHLSEKWRQRRLKQHKRAHGDGKYVSLEWRHFVAELAKEVWGEDWEDELESVIMRHNNGFLIPSYSKQMPSGLFYKVSEEMKDRARRKTKKVTR